MTTQLPFGRWDSLSHNKECRGHPAAWVSIVAGEALVIYSAEGGEPA